MTRAKLIVLKFIVAVKMTGRKLKILFYLDTGNSGVQTQNSDPVSRIFEGMNSVRSQFKISWTSSNSLHWVSVNRYVL